MTETKPCQWCGALIFRSAKQEPYQWRARRFCGKPCGSFWLAAQRYESPLDRLKRKSKPVGDCLEWTGTINKDGYGTLTFKGRQWKAHRLAYEIHVGSVPADKMVCHRCDNRKCIEPDHLFLGDNAENTRDRNIKGRQARGALISTATLTPDDVRAIRASDLPHSVLAMQYGVAETTIASARKRKSWRHVD